MADVIILGCGPAGGSAALYTARAGLATLVIGRPGGALAKTEKIGNYYGFAEPVSGKTLLENGLRQMKSAGAELLEESAVGISWDGRFLVSTAREEYRAPFVILATGAQRSAPAIPGLAALEGHGVSYCAVCDAFFYRGKAVAVLGNGEYALHEARELSSAASSVTILTNGAEPAAEFPKEFPVEKRKIAELFGEEKLRGVRFEDGTELAADGVFAAVGVAGSTDLARKLGAAVKGQSISVDGNRQTTVPGLYAAGDCTGGLLQISKAVCDGAVAGTSVVKAFRAGKAAGG
jgi:thioredoxin reductase (NADPH)